MSGRLTVSPNALSTVSRSSGGEDEQEEQEGEVEEGEKKEGGGGARGGRRGGLVASGRCMRASARASVCVCVCLFKGATAKIPTRCLLRLGLSLLTRGCNIFPYVDFV